MSTSVRYGQLHSEIHHVTGNNDDIPEKTFNHLIYRGKMFRNALVSLYISVGFFALASLLGGITVFWAKLSFWLIISLTFLGISALLFAAYELIRESIYSLEIICEHRKRGD